MTKRIGLSLILFLSFSLVLWQGSTRLFAAPAQQATPDTTAEPAEEPSLEHTHELTATATTTPTLADLAAHVAALQAQVDALSADSAGLASEVTTAVYLLDTAGLHDLDVRLNDAGVIEPADAGAVGRVARLLSSVDWPQDLAADAASLTDLLTQLAAALRDDDVETAAALATQVHETQHDFSHAADHWLGDVTVASGHEAAGQAFRVTSAVYLLDTAGLHDLDVRLNDEGVIEPSDAGAVGRVARLLTSVDWPQDLAADAASLTDLLTELAAALSNDDLETAAALATQVHDSQHDFSHAAEHWLSATDSDQAGHGDDHGEVSESAADDHGHDEAGEDEDHSHGEDGEESSENGG